MEVEEEEVILGVEVARAGGLPCKGWETTILQRWGGEGGGVTGELL